jgi:rRNA maturation RNase YbeY
LVKSLQVSSIDRSINKRAVHSLVASLKNELKFKIAALFINFISSDDLLKLNKKYLKHNFRTDVIAFNYAEKTELDGEILISVEDASINAKRYKTKYSDELSRLVIHGILHLLGYNDQKTEEKILMQEMEKRLIYKNKFTLLASR